MGGSANAGKSKSEAGSSEDVWGPQGNALQNLYSQAESLFGGQDMGHMNNMATNLDPYNQSIMDSAKGGMDNMMGGGSMGDTSEIRNQLMDSYRQTMGGSNQGKMYESIVGGAGNSYIDPMVDAMKSGAMENMDMMRSGNAMDATMAGQGGSSRHAMENAMSGRAINQDMMNKESMMRGGAYDKDMDMKMNIARAADSGIQNSQRGLMDMLNSSDRNVNAGMNYGSQAQNLGMGMMAPHMQNYMTPWNAMGAYTNSLGRPTVLGESSQEGSSYGMGGSASLW